MHLHQGTLDGYSVPGQETVFTMTF
jgi:hypothetical protein